MRKYNVNTYTLYEVCVCVRLFWGGCQKNLSCDYFFLSFKTTESVDRMPQCPCTVAFRIVFWS